MYLQIKGTERTCEIKFTLHCLLHGLLLHIHCLLLHARLTPSNTGKAGHIHTAYFFQHRESRPCLFRRNDYIRSCRCSAQISRDCTCRSRFRWGQQSDSDQLLQSHQGLLLCTTLKTGTADPEETTEGLKFRSSY